MADTSGINETGGGDSSTLIRRPSRLPASFFDEDSNDSMGTESTVTTNAPCKTNGGETSTMIGAKTNQENGMDDFGDEEVIFEDEMPAEKKPIAKKRDSNSEVIKTVPYIQLEKKAKDVQPPKENHQIIVVPPSDNTVTIADRFHYVHNRQMKYSLNQYWQTYNYLKRNPESGLNFIKDQKGITGEIADRMKKTAVRRLGTVTNRLAKTQEDQEGEAVDPEYFWHENLAFWMNQFQWRRRDGPNLSIEDLDKELEEYMSSRCNSRASLSGDFDIDTDLSNFLRTKGVIRDDPEELDKDMDDYWAKKSKPDMEVKEEVNPVAQKKGWCVSTNKMTPQERMRQSRGRLTSGFNCSNGYNGSSKTNLNVDDLDNELDNYMQRSKQQSEKEKVQKEQEEARKEQEKKAAEAARLKALAEQHADDEFAPDDFDVYNDSKDF